MAYEIYLKKNEEKRIINGHSWVYANEVSKIENKDKNGSLAAVYSYDGRFIGKGYINHASKILVRIFIRNDETDDEEFYLARLKAANDYRLKLGYKNCYRMVFAEADNLPALIVDKYADVLVIQCLSLGIDMRKKLICDCLVKLFSPKGIYERSDVSVRKKEGLPEIKQVLYGEVPDFVQIDENGIKMLVDVKNGQKTGYFLDQKENRLSARKYCGGEVLDCFCNSGGFSLNAATAADKVTACDISRLALKNVRDNAVYVSRGYDTERQYGRLLHIQETKFITEDPWGDDCRGVEITFKNRHTPEFTPAHLTRLDDGEYVIESAEKIQGIAPGQFAVIYDPTRALCLGSGIITGRPLR